MIKHENNATALKIAFLTGTDASGNNVLDMKTINNLNGEASDDDLRSAYQELSTLYADTPMAGYRVDTFALREAA